MLKGMLRSFNKKRIIFSINGTGKIGYSYAKEWIWILTSYYIQKIIPKYIKVLNVAKTITLLENIEINPHDFGFGNGFLHIKPKT